MACHQSPTRKLLARPRLSQPILAEKREADRELGSDHYVRHEEMKKWLLSWGTEHELPPPECVCGETH